MKHDAQKILSGAIASVLPDRATREALQTVSFGSGKRIVIAVGKAAWRMASVAEQMLNDSIDRGIVITKYGYSGGVLPHFSVLEAGHPVPDKNGFAATEQAMQAVTGLNQEDTVLLLLSGGGSALFEKPLVPEEELIDLTTQLLRSGANITEVNTIRKRLSAVKGGRFATLCAPAKIVTVAISDVIGDAADCIASGPAVLDRSTSAEAQLIAERYGLRLSDRARALLAVDPPKSLENAEILISGSVRQLCDAAARIAERLGYTPQILTTELSCEAREAGAWLGRLAREQAASDHPIALLAGGETVVHVTGDGLGGRNQEIALAAAKEIAGCENIVVFSFGSDGTDGPTDAAGGIVDGTTEQTLFEKGITIDDALRRNDAYHALQAADALLFTGSTGTNVNDLSVALIRPASDRGKTE